MQFSNFLTVLALAMTASALPADNVVARSGGDSPAPCSNHNERPVCCTGLLGGILCSIDILGLGGICNAGSYCCETSGAHGTIINIDLLNCVRILG